MCVIWPSCTWREDAKLVMPGVGCASLLAISTLAPGLDYLDVMALWDHNVFLGEQVLDSVLRDDILYLKKGGEQAGAGSRAPGAQQGWRSGGQGRPPPPMAAASTLLEGCPPQVGTGREHSGLCSAAAHLVVRSHQMLYRLAICCGDLLDVGGFLLPGPSQR